MEYVDEIHQVEEPKKLRISLGMLVKRHLPPEASKIWTQDDIFDDLNKITHVRLDREQIGKIDGLELLGSSVTNLYLQHNMIEKIENLEGIHNLIFFTASANRIKEIKGLTRLPKLAFLDLSDNQIQSLDFDELPQSLVILNLTGNPCTEVKDYRERLIQELPNLQQLDGKDVARQERREAGFVVSSESESSDEEEDEDDNEESDEDSMQGIKGIFKSQTTGILLRARSQMKEVFKQHQEHMDILNDLRSKTSLDSDIPDQAEAVQPKLSARMHSPNSQFQKPTHAWKNTDKTVPILPRPPSSDSSGTISPDFTEDSQPQVFISPFGILQGGSRPGTGSRLGAKGAPLGPITKS